MNRNNLIKICTMWKDSHYNFREEKIMNLKISDLDDWLKRLDDRWEKDDLEKIDKQSKVDLIIVEQHSELEESVEELINLLKSPESNKESIKKKIDDILDNRNDEESEKEKEINDLLYGELKNS